MPNGVKSDRLLGSLSDGSPRKAKVRVDPIAVPHVDGANPGYLACLDRMNNGGGDGGELKGIAIAAGYEHSPAPTFLFGHSCGEKSSAL